MEREGTEKIFTIHSSDESGLLRPVWRGGMCIRVYSVSVYPVRSISVSFQNGGVVPVHRPGKGKGKGKRCP